MEEKRKDLVSSKQKSLIDRLLAKLIQCDPSLYYLAASDIANELHTSIKSKKYLNQDEFLLLAPLSRRDIQIILSFH